MGKSRVRENTAFFYADANRRINGCSGLYDKNS